jgi:hypothetical protein
MCVTYTFRPDHGPGLGLLRLQISTSDRRHYLSAASPAAGLFRTRASGFDVRAAFYPAVSAMADTIDSVAP